VDIGKNGKIAEGVNVTTWPWCEHEFRPEWGPGVSVDKQRGVYVRAEIPATPEAPAVYELGRVRTVRLFPRILERAVNEQRVVAKSAELSELTVARKARMDQRMQDELDAQKSKAA
jgi:hypothetical protein